MVFAVGKTGSSSAQDQELQLVDGDVGSVISEEDGWAKPLIF